MDDLAARPLALVPGL